MIRRQAAAMTRGFEIRSTPSARPEWRGGSGGSSGRNPPTSLTLALRPARVGGRRSAAQAGLATRLRGRDGTSAYTDAGWIWVECLDGPLPHPSGQGRSRVLRGGGPGRVQYG